MHHIPPNDMVEGASHPPTTDGPPDVRHTDTRTETAAKPGLTIANATVSEGEGILTFTVSLHPATTEPVTVRYDTSDGDAKSGADYASGSGILTFAAGAAAAHTIPVTIRDDAVNEPDENFQIRLSNPQGAVLANATATGTIKDDDQRSLIALPAALNVPEGESASYTLALSTRPVSSVTVQAAFPPELSVIPESLEFTPGDWASAKTVTVTAHRDIDEIPAAPVVLTNTARGGGYDGYNAPVTVTVVEVDTPSLSIGDASAPEGGGTLQFAVNLSVPSNAEVTVEYESGAASVPATAGTDYRHARGTVTFAAGSHASRTIEVTVHDDDLDEPDEQVTITLSNPLNAILAGAGATVSATGTIKDDDPPPQLAISDAAASEDGASLQFAVTLLQASGRDAQVDYVTNDDTAHAGADYTLETGMLAFPAGTVEQVVAVPLLDDDLDEDDETFRVMLSNARHAILPANGGTGTITDDDSRGVRVQPTALTLSEGDGTASYTVALTSQPTDSVTVAITVSPATASVSVSPVALTFAPQSWNSAQTVRVTAGTNATAGESVTMEHSVSGGDYAGHPAQAVTVSITEAPPPRLNRLQVTGGSTMYPTFESDTLHYALTCENATSLQVTAEPNRLRTTLTLLRDDSDRNIASTGTLSTQVMVNSDHDIAINVSDGNETTTYVVHCIPTDFPTVKVLKKTTEASQDSLLFVTPRYKLNDKTYGYTAILDYNGVPRLHLDVAQRVERNFRRHGHPDGWYAVARRYPGGPNFEMVLYNDQFEQLDVVRAASPLTATGGHEFLFHGDNRLFISFNPATRDFEPYGGSSDQNTRDSIIQEVSPQGTEVYQWNSWDYRTVMQLGDDCTLEQWPGEYAHLNSLQVIDGDIIASFRRCSQILRIDWSDPGRGTVKWKLGGTAPEEDTGVQHLKIVGDDGGDNEFCGQHQATLMPDGKLILFDNGIYCSGPRKADRTFSRVVEYDISSGTHAQFVRQYRRASKYGYTDTQGGVTVLDDNTRWLIAWGSIFGSSVPPAETVAVSEVDPATNTALFELHMSKGNATARTYRAYREREADVSIPLNLP
jgi:hypothetical protein